MNVKSFNNGYWSFLLLFWLSKACAEKKERCSYNDASKIAEIELKSQIALGENGWSPE